MRAHCDPFIVSWISDIIVLIIANEIPTFEYSEATYMVINTRAARPIEFIGDRQSYHVTPAERQSQNVELFDIKFAQTDLSSVQRSVTSSGT